jgi:hypothetical protein
MMSYLILPKYLLKERACRFSNIYHLCQLKDLVSGTPKLFTLKDLEVTAMRGQCQSKWLTCPMVKINEHAQRLGSETPTLTEPYKYALHKDMAYFLSAHIAGLLGYALLSCSSALLN